MKQHIHTVIRLLRVGQWYKNFMIFLPLIFAKELLNLNKWPVFILGFIALCFISSANYIINDIKDAKEDRHNIKKRSRPIAKGKISAGIGFIIAIILTATSFYISLNLEMKFFFAVLALLISGQLYTFFLKDVLFLDIIMIGINFILRAVSGSFLLTHYIKSQWIILCVFFFALYLATGKRYSEVIFLEEKSGQHRKTLKHYTKPITTFLLSVSTTMFLLCFSVFTIFSEFSSNLLYLVPLFTFVIFRYTYLILTGSEISRHPEKSLKDIQLVLSSGAFVILAMGLIYFAG